MSVFDVLLHADAKVLLDDQCGVESNVRVVLHTLKLHGKYRQCVVSAVTDQERKIDELMRIGELREEVEMLGKMLRSIAERRGDQHTLFIADSIGGGVDAVEIDVLNLGVVDLNWCVVVVQYGRSHVCMPVLDLIGGHSHWRLGGPEAVESDVPSQSLSSR